MSSITVGAGSSSIKIYLIISLHNRQLYLILQRLSYNGTSRKFDMYEKSILCSPSKIARHYFMTYFSQVRCTSSFKISDATRAIALLLISYAYFGIVLQVANFISDIRLCMAKIRSAVTALRFFRSRG
jgi:hypothetical protein